MELKFLLENAIHIAVSAHTGQFDKGGNPYILHPLYVMMQMDTDDERIIAILHDVIEDTKVSIEYLQSQGFPKDILDDLLLLTHNKNVPYETYIMNIKTSKRATKIKLADIKHNCDFTRMHDICEKQINMIRKYHQARFFLTQME